jgi:hypothetical protein
MSMAGQQVLDSFDSLAEADKHQVAIEILHRFAVANTGDFPEGGLVEAADELFRSLDVEELEYSAAQKW